MEKKMQLYFGCPVQHARQFIAGKWQIGILWSIRHQARRFIEIRNDLPGISDKALNQELNHFVEKRIVERKMHEFPEHKTEYSLTPAGRSLIPVITSIVEWGYLHLQDEHISKEMSQTPLTTIRDIEESTLPD